MNIVYQVYVFVDGNMVPYTHKLYKSEKAAMRAAGAIQKFLLQHTIVKTFELVEKDWKFYED